MGEVDRNVSATTCRPGGTMTPTSPGAAMNVSTSWPSTVARQPGSNATLSTTAPCRCIRTRALNVPSTPTAACASITPGGPWVTPMTAVIGTPSRPPYSTEGITAGFAVSIVGRIRPRYDWRSGTAIGALVSATRT